jgi:hypothetical protein
MNALSMAGAQERLTTRKITRCDSFGIMIDLFSYALGFFY